MFKERDCQKHSCQSVQPFLRSLRAMLCHLRNENKFLARASSSLLHEGRGKRLFCENMHSEFPRHSRNLNFLCYYTSIPIYYRNRINFDMEKYSNFFLQLLCTKYDTRHVEIRSEIQQSSKQVNVFYTTSVFFLETQKIFPCRTNQSPRMGRSMKRRHGNSILFLLRSLTVSPL